MNYTNIDSVNKDIHLKGSLNTVKNVFLKHVKDDNNLSQSQKKAIKSKLIKANNIQEFNAIKDNTHRLSQEKHTSNQQEIDRLKTNPLTLKENSLFIAKSAGGILGGLALLGIGAAIVGMQPRPYQDLSKIVPPDPLTAPYMNMFGAVQLSPYVQNPGQQQLENGFAKLAAIASGAGAFALKNVPQNFSKESREEFKKSKINRLENGLKVQEVYVSGYKNIHNSQAYKNMMLANSLNDFVGNSKNLSRVLDDDTFIIKSEADFEKEVAKRLNEENSPIKDVYQEFINSPEVKENDFDENYIKQLFTKKLFAKLIDIKFENGFLNDATLSKVNLSDGDKDKFKAGLNKFIHDAKYKGYFLSENKEDKKILINAIKESLGTIDTDLISNLSDPLKDSSAVILLNKACDIMNSKAHQDYKEQGEKSLPNMLKLLALYHKEKLKKSGEYNIIRQFYSTNNV